MLGRYSSSCKVKLTVQRAAPPLGQIVNQDDDDDQLLTPPSVAKIITGPVRKKPVGQTAFILLLLAPPSGHIAKLHFLNTTGIRTALIIFTTWSLLQGPSPGDVQNMLRKLPYLALYMSRYCKA